jgi:outer membrane protein
LDIFSWIVFEEEIVLFLKKTFGLFVMVLIVLNLTAFSVQAASDKIGFIDSQQILVTHPKFAQSQKQVEDFITKKTDEAKAAAEKETDAAKRMRIIDAARQESANEEMKVMNPITSEINKIIESVARAKGLTIVMEKVYIFFGGVDITEDVIKSIRAIK